ncbi:DEAD/DEAH box helicase [Sphingobacterium multivorum]|uniref:DEAD/DEAH box helicase n=1 Tax=Sphingobacterium multivorum TaxID=28454 RepID=UPI0028997873|nr:DEAD/DEAH box helicase [Sphingobacterium multivorum]
MSENFIRRIIESEKIEDIFSFVLNNIFRNGPNTVSDLEILTLLCVYHPEQFQNYLSKILFFIGIFYKTDLQTSSLEEVIFGQYRRHIKREYHHFYTPVQAKILFSIENKKCYSFSAPTSTGKSFVFLNKIKEAQNDVIIVVPSRALINEYLIKLDRDLQDKSINILPFIDKINTKRTRRNIFIVTPERCRELFKLKSKFIIDLFLFDEAQLSNEESTRGLLFDGIVRRCYKNFPNSTFVFAHPFVKNPEAQFLKNNIDFDIDNYFQFIQKNVGQTFFYHNKTQETYHHFGIDKSIMGNFKYLSKFDPVEIILNQNGSVLFYVSKTSIKTNKVFEDFKDYIKLCREYDEDIIREYIHELIEYTGGTADKNKDYYSRLISYLKRGIVIHHGSLPLKIRSVLEKYTNEGLCRICFATSTLEQGVNMPFDLVYLNKLDGSKPLSVKNLIGRAGRSTMAYKFDYGFVVVKNIPAFRNIMLQDEELETTSLLEIQEPEKDDDYNDFKDAILNESFDDDFNLTQNQVAKLSSDDIFSIIEELLDSIFEGEEILSLEVLNEDINEKHSIYEKFSQIYSFYLKRELSHGEQNVFNTAIKIILWKVHGKTFRNICWYRYSYTSLSNLRRLNKNNRFYLDRLTARWYTECPTDFPNKHLQPYNALSINGQNILAKDVDYDFIISDTYDYIDKLIGFKLADVFYAAFYKYYEKYDDPRALKLSKYIKYGTDNERHILLMRYGLSFEDIEILDQHIDFVSEEELIVNPSIYELSDKQIEPIKRYLYT